MFRISHFIASTILLCLLSINTALSFGDLIPNPLLYNEMPFDVINYDVNLDLRNYSNREVSGNCEITVERLQIYDGDYFIFHLNTLKVISITANDIPVSYSTYGEESSPEFHYRVQYPDAVTNEVVFSIQYEGKVSAENGGTFSWGGVHYEEAVFYALGVGFVAPYISTTRHWMPCFDLPQDKATFNATFKVPADFKVASNGLLTDVKTNEDGSEEYQWVQHYPAATYLLTFAAGPYQLLDYTNYKIPIQVFSLMTDSAKSDFAYSEVSDMNDCFESLFGAYPFEKIGYTNVSKGAMEHQTMISMPRSTIVKLNSTNNSNNVIAAHELSHMWFGNMVTPIDFRHTWLNESFATYCESLWLRCRDGFSAYLINQKYKADYYLKNISQTEGIFPLFDYPRDIPSSNYPQTIYEKGAVVLGMLSWELEKSGHSFEQIMRKYLNIFAYGNAQTKDVFRILESETGENWDWFAEQWVYKAGWPKFEIIFEDFQNNQYSSKMQIRQIQKGDLFKNIPFEITFYINDGTKKSKVIPISHEITDYTLDGIDDFSIDSIKVNEGNIVAGLYELNEIRILTSVNNDLIVKPELFQKDDYFCINVESEGGLANVSIVDIFGRSIVNYEKQLNSGMNSIRFLFNNQNSATYFINLLIDNKYYTYKTNILR